MKITYQQLLDNPGLFDRIQADARRERSQSVYRLLLAPLASIVSRAFRGPHAARPHLARQG